MEFPERLSSPALNEEQEGRPHPPTKLGGKPFEPVFDDDWRRRPPQISYGVGWAVGVWWRVGVGSLVRDVILDHCYIHLGLGTRCDVITASDVTFGSGYETRGGV